MLRSCVLKFKGHSNEYLPFLEFTYNNIYHSSIEMSHYEALYGKQCRTPLCWNETGERKLLGPEIVQATWITLMLYVPSSEQLRIDKRVMRTSKERILNLRLKIEYS